jgi:hypothetical protein
VEPIDPGSGARKSVYVVPLVLSSEWKLNCNTNVDIRQGVSRRIEHGRRPPALQAGFPQNRCQAVSGVACPQGVEGSGSAAPGEKL